MGFILLYYNMLSYRYSSLSLFSCFKLTKRLMKETKRYTKRCFFFLILSYFRQLITLTAS